jgi:lauroyl/myristoyl acyltransferase
MCSNLKYFAKIDKIDFVEFYRNLLIQRDLGWNEAHNAEFSKILLENLRIKFSDFEEHDLYSEPKIFCSYHLGAYRQLVHFFNKHNKQDRLALVVDENSFKMASKSREVTKELFNVNLKLINAEKAGGIFEMLRFLKQGGSLMFYIDGNNGIGNLNSKLDAMVKVDLLHSPFFSRRGIAEISYITNTPIVVFYTVRNRHNPLENTITFCNRLLPNKMINRDDEVYNLTQKIYDILSRQLLINIDQWEGWLYYQYFIETNKPNCCRVSIENIDINTLKYDKERYGLLIANDNYYIYDTNDRIVYRATKRSHEILKLYEINKTKNLFVDDELKKLIAQNILIKQ